MLNFFQTLINSSLSGKFSKLVLPTNVVKTHCESAAYNVLIYLVKNVYQLSATDTYKNDT